MDSGYKLKICSKKLSSGKCQIKFHVTPPDSAESPYYGYLLAESGSTLREVVGRIESEVRQLDRGEFHFQDQLFNLGRRTVRQAPIYFFRES